MIRVSLADCGRILAAGLALAIVSGAAGAQETPAGSPKPLTPQGAPAPLEAPPPLLPGQPTEAPPPPSEPASPGIQIGELSAPDTDSGGILDPSMGGLGIDMWAGTDRARLLSLLPQLPTGYRSPTLHDLARRLLLSSAIAPPRSDKEPGGSLIDLRIEKLAEMGLSGAVAEMLAIVPPKAMDGKLLRLEIDNRLLVGDDKGACDAASKGGDSLDSLYRSELSVFCSVLAGHKDTASVTTDLLREGGELDDPAFFSLADALTSGIAPKITTLPAPTPIDLAMAAAAKAKLPSDVLQTKSLKVLRALADAPSVSESTQLAAAERAALAGALDANSLAERYAALKFDQKQLDNAIKIAEQDYSPRNRALLYQAAKLQTLPVAQAAAMQKAWKLARAAGTYRLSVRVYRSLLESLQPQGEMIWFAPQAVRALLLLDRHDQALAWALAARRYAKEPEEKQSTALLWPMVGLAEGSATGPGQDEWLAALKDTDRGSATMKAGYAYSLFEAMGEQVPDERWNALLWGSARASVLSADPAYLRAFREAAAAGRRGETVLFAVILLGDGGLDNSDPGLVSEIVVGLRKVGLESEARQLAIEAALAAGL